MANAEADSVSMKRMAACACVPVLLCSVQVFSMGDIRPAGVSDPEARAALVWILGQFGQHVEGR